jgi:hypothetical protein
VIIVRPLKQQRRHGIIAFGSHHQLGYSDVKGRLDGPASGQSLVEADAEPDGRAVAHRLPHANNARNHRREGLSKPFRPARIDDDASHVLADGFECLYQTIHRNDVDSPVIVFGRETSLLTAAVTDELDEVRLKIDQCLSNIAWADRPLRFYFDAVSLTPLFNGLLDLTYLFIDSESLRA